MSSYHEGSGNQDLRPWFIYTLHDPRYPSMVRYVGWATDTKRRLVRHIAAARANRDQTYCGRWKRTLLEVGVEPILTVVESGVGDGWGLAESKWVTHFRSTGHNLTNLTDGGDGTRGYTVPLEKRRKLTDEQKRKIGDSHRGRKHTSESRTNMRLAHLGKKHTPEQTFKISQANSGKKRPIGAIQKTAEANKGRKQSPEEVAKRTGRKRSLESRERMRRAHLGVPLKPEHAKHAAEARVGRKESQTTKEKISSSLKAHYSANGGGRKMSDETKAKISKSNKEFYSKIPGKREVTPEARIKISNSLREYYSKRSASL